MNASGNKDLDGMRALQQIGPGQELIDDADPQGNRLDLKNRQQSDVSSAKRGHPTTTDFYVPKYTPQDQNQSLLSQDFVYLNDNIAPRPSTKGTV